MNATQPSAMPEWPERVLKLGLALGFCALGIAVLAAHLEPAQGYELSIYAATPTVFWIGCAFAMAVSLATAFSRRDDRVRLLALVLGVGVIMCIVALPLLRSYHFFADPDSLTHLGWARDIARGTISPFDLFYPGMHLFAVLTSEVLGVSLRRGLLLWYPTIVFVFVCFIPLAVREIVGDGVRGLLVGTVTALLLLPLNHLMINTPPHPISQAVMFSSVPLYLVLKYVGTPVSGSGWQTPSAAGAFLALVSVALVLQHPQQALNLLLVLGCICVIQYAYRSPRFPYGTSAHRPLYVQTGFLAAVFVGWNVNHPTAREVAADRILVLSRLVREPASLAVAHSTATRSDSASEIGVNILELFAKLFLVSAVFSLLAAITVAVVLYLKLRGPNSAGLLDGLLKVEYLVWGSVPVGLLFAVFLVGRSASGNYFRYLGSIMLVASVVGAVGLFLWLSYLDVVAGGTAVRAATAVWVALLLLLSVPIVFQSPYIYLSSSHVSHQQMNGHEVAFENRADGMVFSGVRSGPWRYVDAIEGTERETEVRDWAGKYAGNTTVSAEVLRGELVGYYEQDRYLIVTRTDRERELDAYRELRYSEEGFDSLSQKPGLHRVQSNGEFTLYVVESEGW